MGGFARKHRMIDRSGTMTGEMADVDEALQRLGLAAPSGGQQ